MAVLVGRLAQPNRQLAPCEALVDFLPFDGSAATSRRIADGELVTYSWGAPGDRGVTRQDPWSLIVDGAPAQSERELIRSITATATPKIGDLVGSFAAVILDQDSLFAYSSAGADYPLYWAADSTELIISNRAGLVVGAVQPTIDTDRALHLVADGYFPSGYGMFTGVNQLLPGDRLRARRIGSRLVIEVDSPDLAALFEYSGRSRPKQLAAVTDECISAAVESLRGAPEAAASLLRLSGGKDSRAVLGMLASAGLAGRLDRIITTGAKFSPDVLSARAVAAAVDLTDRHVIGEPALQFEAGQLADGTVASLAAVGSALSLFDVPADVFRPDRLTFSGMQEALKPSALSAYPVDDFDSFAAAASRHALDPADILQTAARDEIVTRRVDGLSRLRGQGVPTDRLAGVVAWRQRGGGWAGSIMAPHRAANRHFNPLMDPALVKLTFCLPRVCTDGGLIPFLLTARAPVNLVDIPFANDSWPRQLGPALEAIGRAELTPRHIPGFGTPSPIRAHFRPWVSPLRGALLRSLVPVLRELSAAHSQAIPFVDRAKLESRLDDVGAERITDPRADIALLGLATLLVTAEYGMSLFGRSTRAAVSEDLWRGMTRLEGITAPEQIIEIYRQEVSMRDGILAEFVRAEQARAMARAGRYEWVPPRARRVGGRVVRKLRNRG